MEAHLPSTASKRKRKSNETPAVVPSEVLSDPAVPPKRKRGRPRKHPLPPPSPAVETNGDNSDAFLDDEDDMVPYNPPVRNKTKKSNGSSSKKSSSHSGSSSKKMKRESTSSSSGSLSLAQLLGKFEEQYDAMGDMYKQMGETLKELRSKVQENRTATEEEIRSELLEEVQESLLKSFGKKF